MGIIPEEAVYQAIVLWAFGGLTLLGTFAYGALRKRKIKRLKYARWLFFMYSGFLFPAMALVFEFSTPMVIAVSVGSGMLAAQATYNLVGLVRVELTAKQAKAKRRKKKK